MTRVLFRPSVPADFLELQGKPPLYRSRCITAVVEGRVIGIGGLVYMPGGDRWASVLMAEEARRYPAAIHRAGLTAIAQFRQLGLRQVFASAQPDNPAAERWLERLGFKPTELAGNRVFVWTNE